MDHSLQQEFAHVWRFLKSGLLTILIFYGFYLSLTEIGIWYIYSSWCASLSASAVTFLYQKYYVFNKSKENKTWVQVGKFVFLAVLCRILNSLALYYLIEEVGFTSISAQVTLTVATSIFAYILFRFWVFTEK